MGEMSLSILNQRSGKPALVTCNQMVMMVLKLTSNYEVTRNGVRTMAIETPGYSFRHAALAALSSRYVQVDELPWQATRFPGIQIKVLMEDATTGLQTVLTRMAPGSTLTDHEHVELEQSWVLEGRLVDHEGEVKAGNYVWRPAGSRHSASAPEGALVLGFFLKPNRFF
jgi:quercetin dioxygenase-like cupin family protein